MNNIYFQNIKLPITLLQMGGGLNFKSHLFVCPSVTKTLTWAIYSELLPHGGPQFSKFACFN